MAETSRIEELRRRVLKDPASIAFAQLAEEYRRAGRFQDAIDTCEGGLAHHPGYLSARVTLGRALLEQGDLDAARLELGQVLRSAPENLAALRGLAEVHHQRGELKEALAYYKTALEFARQDPELEHAIEEITRELEPNPPPPPVVDGLSFEDVKNTFLNLEETGGPAPAIALQSDALVAVSQATDAAPLPPAEAAAAEEPPPLAATLEAAVPEATDPPAPEPEVLAAPAPDLDLVAEATIAIPAVEAAWEIDEPNAADEPLLLELVQAPADCPSSAEPEGSLSPWASTPEPPATDPPSAPQSEPEQRQEPLANETTLMEAPAVVEAGPPAAEEPGVALVPTFAGDPPPGAEPAVAFGTAIAEAPTSADGPADDDLDAPAQLETPSVSPVEVALAANATPPAGEPPSGHEAMSAAPSERSGTEAQVEALEHWLETILLDRERHQS